MSARATLLLCPRGHCAGRSGMGRTRHETAVLTPGKSSPQSFIDHVFDYRRRWVGWRAQLSWLAGRLVVVGVYAVDLGGVAVGAQAFP